MAIEVSAHCRRIQLPRKIVRIAFVIYCQMMEFVMMVQRFPNMIEDSAESRWHSPVSYQKQSWLGSIHNAVSLIP